jgi:hypothetical protein
MSDWVVDDSAGIEMLTQVCQALDRAEALHELIEKQGAIITVRGVQWEHPALKAELANRAFVVRTL